MDVVPGIAGLEPRLGRLFVVVGVFDGLHRGHAYLLRRLVAGARARGARPAVITFDSHPDEVLRGVAPPLLLDPQERLDRLAAAGVEVTVVQHFDRELRETPYDAFVRRIAERVGLAGFLMTPDAAFGYERGGTPETLAALGAGGPDAFDVEVVPTYRLARRPVRSSEIRAAIGEGDLAVARELLGRPHAVAGEADGRGSGRLTFPMPVALPPPGEYRVRVGTVWRDGWRGRATTAIVDADGIVVAGDPGSPGRLRVAIDASAIDRGPKG